MLGMLLGEVMLVLLLVFGCWALGLVWFSTVKASRQCSFWVLVGCKGSYVTFW